MKLCLAAAAVAMPLLGAPARAEGALATGPRQSFGFGYNYGAPRDARMRALEECGSGCSIVTMFRGACAAFAADRSPGSTASAWAEASDSRRAERSALESCGGRGGRSCQVKVVCDDG